MRILKRLAGFLGIGNQEVNKDSEDVNELNNSNSVEQPHHYNTTNLPRKGFSVSVQAPVDKAHQIGPILVPCPAGDGGVQGLRWYTQRLKIDEDGDVADEFLDEVIDSNTAESSQKRSSIFEVKLSTKPAKARNPQLSQEGKIQHHVEFQGQWQLIG